MPRPCKQRRVRGIPGSTFFKPARIPTKELEQISLRPDEFEAIKLKDVQGLSQEECATRMDVSQPTFHRILQSARQKVGEALVAGKAIAIEKDNIK